MSAPLSSRPLRAPAGVSARLVCVKWTDERGPQRATVTLGERERFVDRLLAEREYVSGLVCDVRRVA